jgi:hypothetical protein
MNKTPTAEEFYIDFCKKRTSTGSFNQTERLGIMIEFAKLHVEAALKEASKNTGHHYSNKDWVDKDSILNAYPLEKIK